MKFRTNQRKYENRIELEIIIDKEEIASLLGNIRKLLDEGYKASNLDGWVGLKQDSTLLKNISEVRFAISNGEYSAIAIYEGRLGGNKMTPNYWNS